MSSSISAQSGLDYVVGDSFGVFRQERTRSRRSDHRHARRFAYHASSRQDAARGAAKRRFARARAGCAVRASLASYRRRAARKGAPAGAGRGSGRRRLSPRRARGHAEIPGRAAAPGSLCRSAGAAAAAPLLHLLVPQGGARRIVADRRRRALCRRQAQAARRRLDLPRRAHRARRKLARLCAGGAWLSPCRAIPTRRSSWSAPAPASRRSAPFCRSARATSAPGKNWLFFGHQRSAL